MVIFHSYVSPFTRQGNSAVFPKGGPQNSTVGEIFTPSCSRVALRRTTLAAAIDVFAATSVPQRGREPAGWERWCLVGVKDLDGIANCNPRKKKPTMWGPPVIRWFIKPVDYSYRYHKP